GNLAARTAGANDGYFAIEGDHLFVQERCSAQLLPGSLGIFRCSHDRLSFAVITQPPRLDDSGKADFAHCTCELRARTNCAPARCWDLQALEQLLFADPVLRGC